MKRIHNLAVKVHLCSSVNKKRYKQTLLHPDFNLIRFAPDLINRFKLTTLIIITYSNIITAKINKIFDTYRI